MVKTVPADKKTSGSGPSGFKAGLRRLCIVLAAGIGCLALSVYVVAYWAERQILTTDNWVQLVSQLPQQPVVSQAIAGTIAARLFSHVSLQDRIATALPPQAAFLAPPLASQVQTVTTNIINKVVASDQFRVFWEGANRIAMNRLLAEARGQNSSLRAAANEKFTINLSGSTGQLRQALGKLSDVFPAVQPAANQAITISTDLQARPRRLQQIVKTTDFMAAVLPLLAAASLLWALAWSRSRWRTAIWLAAIIIGLMLIELIGVNILRQQVLDKVQNPANLMAVGRVFDLLVAWLRRMIYAVAVITAVALVVLVGLGPAAWARRLRTSLQMERIMQSSVATAWVQMRSWLNAREYYVWLAIGGLILLATAFFANGNTQTIVNALLLMLGLFALVHLLATPRKWAT